jgi:hypothetical protein
MKTNKGTTAVGHKNRNDQVTLALDNPNGTDHGQSVYALRCDRSLPDGTKCGFVYGVNGSDIFQAKCPKCQGGNEKLELIRSYT